MNDMLLVLAVVSLVVTGQLLLKIGMNSMGVVGLDRLKSPFSLAWEIVTTPTVITGLMLYGISAVAWVYVLSRVELSYAYPFLALSYTGVTGIAVLVLKEPFSRSQWLGVLLVVTGVVVVALTG